MRSMSSRRARRESKRTQTMKKVDIQELARENAFDLIGKEWMLVTVGNKDKLNTMTASLFMGNLLPSGSAVHSWRVIFTGTSSYRS